MRFRLRKKSQLSDAVCASRFVARTNSIITSAALTMSSPPIRHASSWGHRSLSVQSHGMVSGVSHCMKTSGDRPCTAYYSGMKPLEDISTKWRQLTSSSTNCSPTPRDDLISFSVPKATWQHITGHFYREATPPAPARNVKAPSFPTARVEAESVPATARPYTGRVVLNLMPPGPASPRFLMPETAQVNVPGAAAPTGRALFPRYLNNMPEAGRFDHLPPPWGPKIAQDADNILRRWPTMAGPAR